MTPPEDKALRRLVGQWVHKADQDIRAAESLLTDDPPLLYPSCFHSQQAAEKYLKALLTWHGAEVPKTHALGQLLDLLAVVDAPLSERLSDATALNPYSIEVRYPADFPEPDAAEAQEALALAEKVRDAVMRALPGF